ncbi:MAG: ATP-binding protein [Nocardiopsaceae bacterium]|nr:ATP-binding protein [Nocardiopsaceae bacterium]
MELFPALADDAGPWFRVLSVIPGHGHGPAGQDFLTVLPAALAAARQGRPFVTLWLCRGGGAPLELITNASSSAFPGRPPDLLFPPGARGVPVAGDWRAVLGRLVWAPCPGRQAPVLLAHPDSGEPPGQAGSGAFAADGHRPGLSAAGYQPLPVAGGQPTPFESALVSLMGRPFGWLVVAEPSDAIGAEVARLRRELDVVRRYQEERSRFDAERAQRRLAELDAYLEAGLWRVRVLAGAASAAELAMLGPVLVGSAGLGQHGYRLRGPDGAGTLADAAGARAPGGDDEAESPFAASAGLLTALAGLPGREVPGVRVLEAAPFDLTSETDWRPAAAAADPGGIELGQILDSQDRPAGTFRVPLSTLNRHAFVTGATRAGKSQTIRHLLAGLTRAGLPWLVIEPAKSEYARIAGRIADAGEAGQVTVINPADPDAIPLSVNPLEPEPGYPVQAHIDMIRSLFAAAFEAEEPFPQIMSQALQRAYQAGGWDVVTGGGLPGAPVPPAVPSLAQLQRAALDVIADVGYGAQLQADVRGFVDVRLRSLRVGSAGRFFEGGHPADIGALLRRNVVLATEDVANDEDKAFLMGTLIIRIAEHLRLRARREGAARTGDGPASARELRHVIVVEEAHRLLRARPAGRASSHAVELFAALLAEIRAYGEGIVVAEQIPAKLIPDVVKNTALKVVHRLPAADDRDLVGATMNLDPGQSRQVVALEPGVAAVFADGMDRPLRVRVPYGGRRESTRPGPPPPVAGSRSAACGPHCTGQRPCTLLELRRADLLAASAEPGPAWLRLWAEVLVLALVTGRGLPAPPRRIREFFSGTDQRLADCLLGCVIDRAVGARATALRGCYQPERLAARAAGLARQLLGDGAGAADGNAAASGDEAADGNRAGAGDGAADGNGAGACAGDGDAAGIAVPAGPDWVIGQVRWLHEYERVSPLAGPPPGPDDPAPPLDFPLPGLPDWPGARAGHRIRALREHPLAPELAGNRLAAWTVLLGDDDQQGFAADLARAAVGLAAGERFLAVARAMSADAWLEVVLSWPRRFLAGPGEPVAGPGEPARPRPEPGEPA